jgi:hypothetical protein
MDRRKLSMTSQYNPEEHSVSGPGRLTMKAVAHSYYVDIQPSADALAGLWQFNGSDLARYSVTGAA